MAALPAKLYELHAYARAPEKLRAEGGGLRRAPGWAGPR